MIRIRPLRKIDTDPTSKKNLIRIQPLRKNRSWIRPLKRNADLDPTYCLPNKIDLFSFFLKVNVIDILIQYYLLCQKILQETFSLRWKLNLDVQTRSGSDQVFKPDPTIFWKPDPDPTSFKTKKQVKLTIRAKPIIANKKTHKQTTRKTWIQKKL